MKHLTALSILLFLKTTAAPGQTNPGSVPQKKERPTATAPIIETVLHLKNGSEIRGTVTDWRQGDRIYLTMGDGSTVYFLADEIVYLEQFRLADRSGLFKNDGKPDSPPEIETALYLKNGSLVLGKIVEWRQGERIVLEVAGGFRLQFAEAEIKKVKQERYGGQPLTRTSTEDSDGKKIRDAHLVRNSRNKAERSVYAFRERGWYNATCLGMMPSSSYGAGRLLKNFTFTTALGFQMSRLGGLGVGIGADKYGSNFELVTVPVFLDFRTYFLEMRRTPYFNLMVGHGFAVDVDSGDYGSPILEKHGGLFISPNFGYRFGAAQNGNFTLDFGAHLQKGVIGFDDFAGNVILVGRFYRRFTLRFGMVF